MHVFSCFSLRFLILILKFFDGFPRQPAALTGGADVLLLLGSSGVLLVLCYPEGPRRTQKDPEGLSRASGVALASSHVPLLPLACRVHKSIK
jgi:hypothetical protein